MSDTQMKIIKNVLMYNTCIAFSICYVYFCNRMTHGYFSTFRRDFENNFLFEKIFHKNSLVKIKHILIM